MNALAALSTGMGIGLAFFGGLWLTVRYALRGTPPRGAIVLANLVRVALAAAAFYAVSREGAGILLTSLAGFWAARRVLIRDLGNVNHAE